MHPCVVLHAGADPRGSTQTAPNVGLQGSVPCFNADIRSTLMVFIWHSQAVVGTSLPAMNTILAVITVIRLAQCRFSQRIQTRLEVGLEKVMTMMKLMHTTTRTSFDLAGGKYLFNWPRLCSRTLMGSEHAISVLSREASYAAFSLC